jgi:hypothetical protein
MTKPRLGRRRKDGNFFSLSLDFNQVFIRRLLRKILNSAIVWKLRTNFLLRRSGSHFGADEIQKCCMFRPEENAKGEEEYHREKAFARILFEF